MAELSNVEMEQLEKAVQDPLAKRKVIAALDEIGRLRSELNNRTSELLQRSRMVADLVTERDQLRTAIRLAGFAVMETSGQWSIHDVSRLGLLDEERTGEVISQNVTLRLGLKRALEALVQARPAVSARSGPTGSALEQHDMALTEVEDILSRKVTE